MRRPEGVICIGARGKRFEDIYPEFSELEPRGIKFPVYFRCPRCGTWNSGAFYVDPERRRKSI